MVDVSALFSAAHAAHQAGQLPQAERLYRQILEYDPRHADALHLLGVLAHQVGQHAAAIELIGRAIAIRPNVAVYYNNLGESLRVHGGAEDAAAAFRRAVDLKPDYVVAQHNLGNVLLEMGRLAEAEDACQRAAALRPDLAETQLGLGNVLAAQRQYDEAIACFRRCVAIDPHHANAHCNLSNVLLRQRRCAEALHYARRAVELAPESSPAMIAMANALVANGEAHAAGAWFRRALHGAPADASMYSNYLVAMQYDPEVPPGEMTAAHAEFPACARLAHPAMRHVAAPADRHGRLRLGFVSADLGVHPVGYFLIGVLEHLDPRHCETICYSDRPRDDECTPRFRAAAGQWRHTFGMSDEALADAIRADRIDILVDLAGHTPQNRLLAFARKPAPLQISWLGYEGHPGLEAIDYLLADRHLAPSAEATGRVLHLPDSAFCYDPPAEAPPVGPLPAFAAGHVTFGSFHNPAKLNRRVLALWAESLRRVPESRLLLKYNGLDEPATIVRLQQEFARCGVDPRRLAFEGFSPRPAYFAAYHRVDLMLDPFPFNGGVTSCDSLWMGVPVITCPGDRFAGRHTLSHLSSLGWTETVASDWQEYLDLAAAWAADLPRLAAVRGGLREKMAGSPLCDARRFADNLLTLLREAWEKRPGAGPPERE